MTVEQFDAIVLGAGEAGAMVASLATGGLRAAGAAPAALPFLDHADVRRLRALLTLLGLVLHLRALVEGAIAHPESRCSGRTGPCRPRRG